jgi:hypothetical protein
MRRLPRSSKTVFFALAVTSLLTACHSYYKTSLARTASADQTLASIDSLKLQNRYFVLRNGTNAYYMNNISLSADQKTLQCNLDTLSSDHELYVLKSKMGKGKYKLIPEQTGVLNEVHLYVPQGNIGIGSYTLSLDQVQKIEVLQKDKARTTRSYIGGALIITGGALVIAAIIIAATKSSCPFVSGYDGNDFTLQGEIYGGAIYPQLARNDYMPLRLSPDKDNKLQLKISNELKERQYTDMADLWAITHKKNTKVLSDDDGNLYSLSALEPPVDAVLSDGKNVTHDLINADDDHVLYFDDTTSSIANNSTVIKFNKPAGQQTGKLFLSLKNSYFLDYLYGELAKGFGSYYSTYMKKQKNKPAAELLKWVKEQQIPLEVSVNTTKGWRKIKDITTIGPVANREIVVPVDLSETTGDITEIKLSSGFMFWEIDAAAMDYTADKDFVIEKLKPVQAVDETGKDILNSISKEDGIYLAQPEIGNTATITYQPLSPISDEQTHSFILHTKGYYEHIRDFTGKPDTKFLKAFTRPNAFPLYGMKQYQKLKNENVAFLK